ncbi:MAG TPA: HemK/PrmC family methyltransferase [Candidatus Saccharimonadales bacterium]|nr:HemK/PrmC family methyltransferase [Candidatus Saccharimonadales bacterium]
MQIHDWLQLAEKQLRSVNIPSARLDSLLILEHVTVRDRAWLLANPEYEISADESRKLKDLLSRRLQHVPITYLFGRCEFYGRTFLLNDSVLDPRPESETMIDLLKLVTGPRTEIDQMTNKVKLPDQQPGQILRICDVGTGSGALGITAKLEVPAAVVDLIDIDKAALKVAEMNVDFFTIEARLFHSDLLANTDGDYDILLCNLPYVPDSFQINTDALHEPQIAIFGGPDGLDAYRRLFQQISRRQSKPLYILCESMPPQHSRLARIASSAGYRLTLADGFIQLFCPV